MIVINIINLPRRGERREAVTLQMESEGCNYVFHPGVEGANTKTNIHKAFKNIIQHYKNMNEPYCCIAEDDLVWTGAGAWQFYLDNMPKEFDIYTGSYYSGSHDEQNVVKGFRGNTLITVEQRFYDKFLFLPENHHLDAAFSISGAKIVTCYPFVCTQAPGYSDQRKRMADDSVKMKNKQLFGQ